MPSPAAESARLEPRPRFALILLAMALITGLTLATPSSAEAARAKAPKVSCKGFANCEKKGFSTRGYRAAKIGSASQWGVTLPKAGIAKLHKNPTPGDVAWWSYRKGSTRKSHLAYVERVYRDGSVLVSEDNYKGTFYYTRYHRGHKLFPSSFLRFKRSTGSPVGKVLSARATGNLVRVEAWHSQADTHAGAVGVVSFGGPRGAPGTVEVRTSRSVLGHWWAAHSFAADKMPKVAYVYALNSKGTKGSDTLLGKITISVE